MLHIEELTSEVTVLPADLELSPEQVDRLVGLVLKRLAQRRRDAQQSWEATRLRQGATPPSSIGV
jgi:hypothetical protein